MKKGFWFKKHVGEDRKLPKGKIKIELSKDIDAAALTLEQVKRNDCCKKKRLRKRPLPKKLPQKKHQQKRNKLWNLIFYHGDNEIIQYVSSLSTQNMGSKVAFHTDKDFPDLDIKLRLQLLVFQKIAAIKKLIKNLI